MIGSQFRNYLLAKNQSCILHKFLVCHYYLYIYNFNNILYAWAYSSAGRALNTPLYNAIVASFSCNCHRCVKISGTPLFAVFYCFNAAFFSGSFQLPSQNLWRPNICTALLLF